ncbi:hypothetical protein CROQUDRAFT_672590 [Cronartium quercuum f. sp. fusiforme G11]|uniref:SCP domain-containing protein n=1 Tax=Cronartium quercuum f. sp. fusiforme G11 TaxID=708437 RepID=A0A9P6NC99_9BASI|nr:hypothetical protein CROQUDRAFT_672590 [Cronartium quercuum f. sp. fusiforme G11]
MSGGPKWMNVISLSLLLVLPVTFTLAASSLNLDRNLQPVRYARRSRVPCQGKDCHSNSRRSESSSAHHQAKANHRFKRGCQLKSIQENNTSSVTGINQQQTSEQMKERLQAVNNAIDAGQSLMQGAEWTKEILDQKDQSYTLDYTGDFDSLTPAQVISIEQAVTQTQPSGDQIYATEQNLTQSTTPTGVENKKDDEQKKTEAVATPKQISALQTQQADEETSEENDQKEKEAEEKKRKSEEEKEAEEKKNEEKNQQEKQAEEEKREAQKLKEKKAEEDAKNADHQAEEAAQTTQSESAKPVGQVEKQSKKVVKVATSHKQQQSQSDTQINTSSSSPTTSTISQSQQASQLAKPSDQEGTTEQARWLKSHNDVRTKYFTASVAWDESLAQYAQGVADTCVFEHSHGRYGENIAAGEDTLEKVVSDWVYGTGERDAYDPINPLYSHFTQVVWKGTKHIGCAFKTCSNIKNVPWTGESKFWVCNYDPPGNYIGEFASNVNAAKGGQPLAS